MRRLAREQSSCDGLMPELYPPAPAPEPSKRAPYRKWAADDQVRAEVAAACGANLTEIGRMLGRVPSLVKNHLVPEAAKAHCESSRRWREKCPDVARENVLLWRETYPEREREGRRRWRTTHPEVHREQKRRSNSRRRSSRGAMTPVTPAAKNAASVRFGNRCAYCGKGGKMTVDHVVALSVGGLDEIGNILPACGRCNCSKNAKPMEAWYRSQPFFSEVRWRKILKHCGPAAGGQLSLGMDL